MRSLTLFVAYIDGGSGSLLLQVLIASVVGIAASGRMFWAKIRSKFSRDRTKVDDE